MPTKLRIAVTYSNATFLGSSALKLLQVLYDPKPDGLSWKKWLSKLKHEMCHKDRSRPSKCAVFLFQEVRRCPKSKSEYRSRFIRQYSKAHRYGSSIAYLRTGQSSASQRLEDTLNQTIETPIPPRPSRSNLSFDGIEFIEFPSQQRD